MSPRPDDLEGAARQEALAIVETRLGKFLGARMPLVERLLPALSSRQLILVWVAGYAALALLAYWWSTGGAPPDEGHAKLTSLNLWNGIHFTALMVVTVIATARILDIVRGDILPFASDAYATAVGAELARKPSFLLLNAAPFALAAATLPAALWAISKDIEPIWREGSPFPLDLLLWTMTSLYIYFAAGRGVAAATFGHAFTHALEKEARTFYPLGAADSPLVKGIARLNRALLVYWTIIFLIIMTAMLLLLPPVPFRLSSHTPYLFLILPASGALSLGWGAYVYLQNEASVGSVLRRYTLRRAQPLQREIDALLSSPELDDGTTAKIDGLRALHDRMIAGGHYGSRLGAAVSVALPLALPVIALIEKLFR